MAYPDARRIDVRATLRDPFESTIVRRFRQRSETQLVILADLSASLLYEGYGRKIDLIKAFSVALARSATRIGDRCSLIGCGAEPDPSCFIPATRRLSLAEEVREKLLRAHYSGASAEGLVTAARRLSGSRKMVFVVSDYQLDIDLIARLFAALARHDFVPVVIGDTSEDARLPDWGLLELLDLETSGRRLVFMRPSLKRRWLEAQSRHRQMIGTLARGYGCTPVTITNEFDADDFSRQLAEG
ncbi:MxaS protein [Labrys sp. WJW]|uniref:DUF58 domain-containing protein n=1 Tax=Labrys sp. WJW TaxID=1737983 RepID=UPI001FD90F41|nr:MxaS protein [Labrys sp. WJW]